MRNLSRKARKKKRGAGYVKVASGKRYERGTVVGIRKSKVFVGSDANYSCFLGHAPGHL